MMAEPKPRAEPTMEEILASIRRIISEENQPQEGDKAGAAPAAASAAAAPAPVAAPAAAAPPPAPATPPPPTVAAPAPEPPRAVNAPKPVAAQASPADAEAIPEVNTVEQPEEPLNLDTPAPLEPQQIPAAPAPDAVLELTQMVGDDGKVVDIRAAGMSARARAQGFDEEMRLGPESEIEARPRPAAQLDKGLLSTSAAAASLASLASLSATAEGQIIPSTGRTLESITSELMQPFLREWLANNLPAHVERSVKEQTVEPARNLVREWISRTMPRIAEEEIGAAAPDVLREMLKAWLDANLPALVERVVRQEIQGLTKRVPR
jgi:uncharacterized protein